MSEKGSTTIKTLLALAVVAAIIVAVVKIVPVYVNVYAFEDAMRQQAKFAGVERKNEAVVRDELYKKAQELNLPITREQIAISKRMGGINIKVSYTVPIDLIVFQRDFNFDYEADTSTAY